MLKYIRILLFLFLLSGCNFLYPLPPGISFSGKLHPTEDVVFLKDLTFIDVDGKRQVRQEIFDEAFKIISNAEKFILLDMFLYNDFQGSIPVKTRALSSELTNLLISQKKKYQAIEIFVITDPVNTVYGGMPSKQFSLLKESGIHVVFTNLDKLPDSNIFYSPFWRFFVRPFGNSTVGSLPNPFGDGTVSLRSYLRLLNFKANHRKVLIADSGNTYVGFVTSANPHDGSSAHGNVAVKFSGPAVQDLIETELAVLGFSGVTSFPHVVVEKQEQRSAIDLQVITEIKIKDSILNNLVKMNKGDRIDLIMFYLSDRKVISALLDAYERGVEIRVLLDPNKDAFGRSKNGIPNRQVARELYRRGISVRWSDTHGEQCHSKMLHCQNKAGESTLILGSANFTRRNLDNFNLETNLLIKGPAEKVVFQDAAHYFNTLWNNKGYQFSVGYQAYEDNSIVRRFLYRFMEATGMSSF